MSRRGDASWFTALFGGAGVTSLVWTLALTLVFGIFIIRLGNDVASLQAHDREQDALISSLEDEVAVHDSMIAMLKTNVTRLQTNVTTLVEHNLEQDVNITILQGNVSDLSSRISMLETDLMEAIAAFNMSSSVFIQNGTLIWYMVDASVGPADPFGVQAPGTYEVRFVEVGGLNRTILKLNPFSPAPLVYSNTLYTSYFNGGETMQILMGNFVPDVTLDNFDLDATTEGAYGYNGQFPISTSNFAKLSFITPGETNTNCITSGNCVEAALYTIGERQSFYRTAILPYMFHFFYLTIPPPYYNLTGSEFSLTSALELLIFQA